MSAVLVISPEPWDAQAVSKHHYARVLAQAGRKVLFLDPPTPAEKRLSVVEVDGLANLRVLRGPRVAPGLRLMPSPLRRWLETRWLARAEALAGTSISTIWLFENSRFFDLRFAGDRLKIYHQVDLNQDFHPAMAARWADVCLCNTDIIRDRLLAVRPDVHKLHHAAIVSGPWRTDPEVGKAFGKPGKHVVCVGNMGIAYLDVPALSRLVEHHPDVTFHFVGEYDKASPAYLMAEGKSNVVWWGRRDHRDIPEMLDAADILLVAYDAKRFRDQLASPHKFMEYLLSGKTIVASYTDEYKDKRHLVEMAGPEEDIDAVFARVIATLDACNAPARMAERRAFALDLSYERQLDRIARIARETTGREL
jgi:glycosyltransferase involved in cell wall biosynthesis